VQGWPTTQSQFFSVPPCLYSLLTQAQPTEGFSRISRLQGFPVPIRSVTLRSALKIWRIIYVLPFLRIRNRRRTQILQPLRRESVCAHVKFPLHDRCAPGKASRAQYRAWTNCHYRFRNYFRRGNQVRGDWPSSRRYCLDRIIQHGHTLRHHSDDDSFLDQNAHHPTGHDGESTSETIICRKTWCAAITAATTRRSGERYGKHDAHIHAHLPRNFRWQHKITITLDPLYFRIL
jgi:hypothetical protein